MQICSAQCLSLPNNGLSLGKLAEWIGTRYHDIFYTVNIRTILNSTRVKCDPNTGQKIPLFYRFLLIIMHSIMINCKTDMHRI